MSIDPFVNGRVATQIRFAIQDCERCTDTFWVDETARKWLVNLPQLIRQSFGSTTRLKIGEPFQIPLEFETNPGIRNHMPPLTKAICDYLTSMGLDSNLVYDGCRIINSNIECQVYFKIKSMVD